MMVLKNMPIYWKNFPESCKPICCLILVWSVLALCLPSDVGGQSAQLKEDTNRQSLPDVMELNPKTSALFDLIQVYTPLIGGTVKKEAFFKAIVLYRELRSKVISTGSPLAREAVEWIDQAIPETLFLAGDTERAREKAESLVERENLLPVTRANIHNLLGRIYYTLENMGKSEEHHRRAIKLYTRLFMEANASGYSENK